MYKFNYNCIETCCNQPGGMNGSIQYNENNDFSGNNVFRYYETGTTGAHGTFTIEPNYSNNLNYFIYLSTIL